MASPTISTEQLHDLMRYDPETGHFTRLVKCGKERRGAIAGTTNKNGYCNIMIGGRLYRAHRLAWFYMTGEWPKGDVDHKNRDRLDNRWENLREATRSQNNANRPGGRPHGLKGAFFYKARGRWMSKIDVNRKQIYLGYYDTAEEAHAAYMAAAVHYFGDFARAA